MSKIFTTEEQIIKNIENEVSNNLVLPDYNKLLLRLSCNFTYTGRACILFCNKFIFESIQLLKNALVLYKKGFFDCAFYSTRQASEVMDNMLFIAKNPKKLNDWKSKGYFPVSRKIQTKLEKISDDYREIKSLLPEYFDLHENLIKKSHKIIHKQGFDTFYSGRNFLDKKLLEKEAKLLFDTLKYTIGKLYILLIVLDPMSLALADKNINRKIALDIVTEPVDVSFFKDVLGLNYIIDRIKKSDYYQNFITYFKEKEELLPSTYLVIRNKYWDIVKLDEIEKQINMLSPDEIFMFYILKNNIKVNIFYLCDGMLCYFTSNLSSINDFSVNTLEFQNYAKEKARFNQHRKNAFISVLKKSKDDFLYIEHSEPLSDEDISLLQSIELEYSKYAKNCHKETNGFISSIN